jgi:uncharacterized protein YbbK (DUF523 family)
MKLDRLFWLLHEQSLAEAEAQARRAAASGAGPVLGISACLAGIPCRFDGRDRLLPDLEQRLLGVTPIPICPEALAGFGTPRSRLTFAAGDGEDALAGAGQLVDGAGREVTARMREAVAVAVRLAQAAGCRQFLLKERSATCGVTTTRTRHGVEPGCGIFSAALRRAGIQLTPHAP